MFKSILTFLGGAVVAVIAENLVWPLLRTNLVEPIQMRRRRRRDAALQKLFDEERFIINGWPQYIYEFVPNGFELGNLTGRMKEAEYKLCDAYRNSEALKYLPGFPEIQQLDSNYEERRTALNSKSTQYWNGSQLAPCQVTRNRTSAFEYPVIHIEFINKDYASHIIGETLERLQLTGKHREFLARPIEQPDSLLATDFGLIINVVTADNQVIVARRSSEAYGWNGFWHVAVAESVTLTDADNKGGISFSSVVRRALEEELGLKLDDHVIRKAVKIHTLNVHVKRHSWMLFVNVNLGETEYSFEKINAFRTVGGRDRWESSNLRLIKYEGKSIFDELKNEKEWIPFGLLCLMLSAIADNILSVDDFVRELGELRFSKR